jgi:uncharacterized membrane protein YkoI
LCSAEAPFSFILHSARFCYTEPKFNGVNAMKKTGAFFAIVAVVSLFGVATAEAGQFTLGHKYQKYQPAIEDGYQISQYAGEEDGYGGGDEYAISPAEAASIAKQSWPGSKVIRVQLLQSGSYAVTLKQGGEVARVLVDASTGELG